MNRDRLLVLLVCTGRCVYETAFSSGLKEDSTLNLGILLRKPFESLNYITSYISEVFITIKPLFFLLVIKVTTKLWVYYGN